MQITFDPPRTSAAIGMLHDRLHVLCFTETADGIRIISFRKANEREVKRHARSHTAD